MKVPAWTVQAGSYSLPDYVFVLTEQRDEQGWPKLQLVNYLSPVDADQQRRLQKIDPVAEEQARLARLDEGCEARGGVCDCAGRLCFKYGQDGFYMGMEVTVVEDCGDGWIVCEWDSRRAQPGQKPPGSGKGVQRWRHWHTQVVTEPWGHTPVIA